MSAFDRAWAACLVGLLAILTFPHRLLAYSALTHEAIVDSAWSESIEPLLQKRFSGVTPEELRRAHAYAYGGCIVQDMGYYPFGNKFVTDLLHYVRSGDFAAALIAEAEPLDEYAFALGALEHYLADQTGHTNATNVVVPLEFPKLREKYDSWVTYEDDPTAHLKIEFGFDVLQVARGRYTPTVNHDFIGFEVARPLLDRTFYKVYGLKLSDLLVSEDLAIGTYRRTVSQIIPEATKIAWELKHDELHQLTPSLRREQFVYTLSRQDYESEWGNQYERPTWFDTLLGLVFRATPKVGPLRALSIKPLTPETERLFEASFSTSVSRYQSALDQLRHPRTPALTDINLDTGAPARAGTYALADDAYAELVSRLRDHYFADVSPALRDNILAFYADLNAPIATKTDEDAWGRLVIALEELRALPLPTEPTFEPPVQPQRAPARTVRRKPARTRRSR